MRLRTLLLALCLPLSGWAQSPSFSHQQVAEDLAYLYQTLQAAHYHLYAYTPQATFDSVYAAVRAAIPADSVSALQANNLFQTLTATARNGHTEVDFPVGPYVEYAYGGGTLFPLEIALEDSHYYVRKNFSAVPELAPGTEILGLDGRPMAEVLDRIWPLISAERPYFAAAKLEALSFPRYYWRAYGPQATFAVQVATPSGPQTYTVAAVPAIAGYEARREEVLNAAMELRFREEAAYLNPGSFGGDLPTYQRFIDSAFAQVVAQAPAHLIVDLRNNSGGDDAYSNYLVSYLADRPFPWCGQFALRSSAVLKAHVRQGDTTTAYSRAILSHADGEQFPFSFPDYEPQPRAQRYTGPVYVLVNRQSHSMAAVTAAQLQDCGWAIVVGEETGEYASLYASQFAFTLPHTGTTVRVAKGTITRLHPTATPSGVIPDLPIRDHLLDAEDEILSGLLKELTRDKMRSER